VWKALACGLSSLLPAIALGQISLPTPDPYRRNVELPPVSIEDAYGPAQPADLSEVAYGGTRFQRRLVSVRGRIGITGGNVYYTLQDGGARVLLVPIDEADPRELARLVGVEVELKGVARVLPMKQEMKPCGPGGTAVPESKCEDPDLPALPDKQVGWPEVSLTVVSVFEREARGGRAGVKPVQETSVDAAEPGKPVRALGQFRGANLCKDLGIETRREAEDWVLLTLDGPVWVTGKKPEGKGFRLDAGYRGDTARWLEVTGKVEKVGDVRYLRASRVALAARPPDISAPACPP
jgi:hypothetical protein